MFHPRPSAVRSAYLAAVCATVFGALSAVHAQQQGAAGQAGPALNPRHPETYVVEAGDTLWEIAAMFLRDPWYWPEIWQVNPQVENPHLIFPGDVLSLAYLADGRPVIRVERGSGAVDRLSPRARIEPIEAAIPTIPSEAVRAFLSRPALIDAESLETLPYIVAHPDRGLMGSAGRDVFVRGTDAEVGTIYNVVHKGNPLVDPDDGDFLGYEGVYVGKGEVRAAGDPATVALTETSREALVGDLLLTEDYIAPATFLPRAPVDLIDGTIISVIDGVTVIGRYQVVVVNRGIRDGLEPGHVLAIYRAGEVITDPVSERARSGEKVRLPDEFSGLTMVFRTFDRLSYALVLEAEREMHVFDMVRSPD